MSTLHGFETGPSEWLVSERPFVVRRWVKWGESVFSAKLSPICIARPERRSIAIPPSFRAKLLAVMTAALEQAS